MVEDARASAMHSGSRQAQATHCSITESTVSSSEVCLGRAAPPLAFGTLYNTHNKTSKQHRVRRPGEKRGQGGVGLQIMTWGP